ncbi:MAG: DegQ family serine endoprotease [Alphaproteobacteria bacterium]|nr:DegQ family serine endoprotease [Alphaproteobacteria bacterium]
MPILRRCLAILVALIAASPLPAAAQAVPQSRAEIAFSFAPVVRRAAPAVVSINTRRTVQAVPSPLFNDPFFRRFFGDMFPGQGEPMQNSLGSGVIVDASGIIVTNNHVIRGAEQIQVVLADRREFDATVLRADERTDLAVLRIDAGRTPLPAIDFRDSDDLEVGDLVLAIGNPFGVGQTVTSGIVSALARTQVGITDFRSFIQTDAAINPGNSGGALVAMDGKLVGINTAIYTRDGGSIGIGFAIPANMVRVVVGAAAAGGRFVRPWLGAAGQTVTADIAASLGLPRPLGVVLGDPAAGSPAERAGLRRGDVITHVEGREVADEQVLRFRIATQSVGATAQLTVWRGGRERTVAVTLVAPPETPPRDATPLRGNNPFAGMTVANLSPALADEIGFEGNPQGVVVTEVRRNSNAATLRVQPGDVILRVNDQAIATVEDMRRAVAQQQARWRFSVRRGDQVYNLVIGR